MDAKTGSVASDDSFRAPAASMSHPKHAYEQVFTTFTTPQQPQFIQSQPPSHEAASENDDDDEDARQSQQKTAGARSPLFWVNTDPQTVKKGSKEEQLKRIRSHVMSEHNRKKRLENTRRYNKSKTWKNLAYRPEPVGASKHPRASGSSLSSPTSSSASDRSSSKSSASPDNREDSPPGTLAISRSSGSLTSETSWVQSTSPSSTQDLLLDQLSAAPRQDSFAASPPFIGSDGIDPFQATQVQLSQTQYQHLKYFLYDLVSQAAPFINHGTAKLRNHWVSLTKSSPSVLYACITSAVTNKSLVTGDFFADQATQRTSPLILDRLRNRGETIGLINRELSSLPSASSDAAIAAVAMLISIEMTGSNPQDVAIHLNGLRKMVSLRKNFADISKPVRWQIEWNDVRSACKTMSRPIFPFIRYTMPAHTPSDVLVENAGQLASSLRGISQIPGIFGVEMCRSIDDLTSLTLYAEIYKKQPQHAASLFDEEIEEYFNNEVLYTEYCLLNDRWTPDGRLRGDDTLEGAVRITCLLFHNTTIWPFYPAIAPLFPMPIFALEAALRNGLAAGRYEVAQELLIWLLFIGACAGKYLPPCRSYFMNELAKAIPIPMHEYNRMGFQLQTFADFRHLLQGYFYVDRCYLAEAREVWMLLTSAGATS